MMFLEENVEYFVENEQFSWTDYQKLKNIEEEATDSKWCVSSLV